MKLRTAARQGGDEMKNFHELWRRPPVMEFIIDESLSAKIPLSLEKDIKSPPYRQVSHHRNFFGQR